MKKIKKLAAVMMAVTMLLSLAGCGKDSGKKSDGPKDIKEMTFRGEDLPIEEYQGDISSFYVKNGKLYFDSNEWATDEDGSNVSRLYSADTDGSNVTEIPIPVVGEEDWLSGFAVGNDGSIALLISSYSEKTESSTYALVKLDEQGNETGRTDITKELHMSGSEMIGGMVMDDKGRCIITMDWKACILDENGNSLGEVKGENHLDDIAVTKDGAVICGSNVYDGAEGKQYAQIQVLDVDGKKWGETYRLDASSLSTGCLMDGDIHDFYYRDDAGIYSYDMAGGKSDKILDYVASYIDPFDNLIPVEEDRMIGMEYGDDGVKFVLYSKADPADIKDKKTIIYGTLRGSSWIESEVTNFNKHSEEYQIEVKDYSGEEDPELKFNTDIAAGNAPDIIDFGNVSLDRYAAKGLLEDLTPYYEKDPEISTEDILDSVLEAMKIDGKLYYAASHFRVASMVAKTSDVGTGTGWTLEELKTLLDEKADKRLFGYDSSSDLVWTLLGESISDFADWKTGECRFDSEEFKGILELCNDRAANQGRGNGLNDPSEASMIQEGKVLFAADWISPGEVELYEKLFGEDVTYIGYPNKESAGSYLQFESVAGIYAKSEVKDGAWEFLRTMMTRGYQGKIQTSEAPTRKDCFDLMIERVTATESYTDEMGCHNSPLWMSRGWGDIEIEIGPLTKEQAEVYRNLVNNTKRTSRRDSNMLDIVMGETKPYFKGEKSLDETAAIIQDRITTYVNEHR